MTTPEIRLEMISAVVAEMNNPMVTVSEKEIQSSEMMSSFLLWKEFSEAMPEDEVSFCIGSDLLE
jgi:nicotinate (nicotinamide) nucleotide adenylyltransferase